MVEHSLSLARPDDRHCIALRGTSVGEMRREQTRVFPSGAGTHLSRPPERASHMKKIIASSPDKIAPFQKPCAHRWHKCSPTHPFSPRNPHAAYACISPATAQLLSLQIPPTPPTIFCAFGFSNLSLLLGESSIGERAQRKNKLFAFHFSIRAIWMNAGKIGNDFNRALIKIVFNSKCALVQH